MDNSPLKHNKRLYSTSLICRKPSDIVYPVRSPARSRTGSHDGTSVLTSNGVNGKTLLRVFLNIGQYNEEVKDQLLAMDKKIELIFL